MAVHLRLRRAGSKKRPFYHIVAADNRFPRDGKFLEKLGTYNPLLPKDSDERCVVKAERASHWISQGAKPTKRVQILLSQKDLYAPFKFSTKTKKHLPKAKAQQRAEQAAAAAAAASQEG